VQLARPSTQGEGNDISDFTPSSSSRGLRDSLARLIRAVRSSRDAGRIPGRGHEGEISVFYDHNMKDLMYRDWSGFELFFIEISSARACPRWTDLAPVETFS